MSLLVGETGILIRALFMLNSLACQAYTVENYCKALQNGTKHIYQMLPRMLTLWLDLGERVAAEDGKRRRSR
jgi:hypothetical protein